MLGTFILLTIVLVAGWFGLRAFRQWQAARRAEEYAEWKSTQRYVVLKVLVPKNNEKGPQAAEQMFAALHGIYREGTPFQDQVSFELVAYNKFIHFYVHVPVHLREFVEGQLYAQYPNIEVTEVEDYAGLLDQNSRWLVLSLCSPKMTCTRFKRFQTSQLTRFPVSRRCSVVLLIASSFGFSWS